MPISLIPLRGGSKGVSRKNIKIINHKPLCYYAIRASNESASIEHTFVSTDDDEIENVEDTLTILSKYVDGLEIQGKKKELDKIMKSLYHEALEEHNFL